MESAKKRFQGEKVSFLEMDAACLEFEDASFDTVCISYSLHHLADVDAVLKEMKRVLRVGGHFIIQEPYCDGDQTEPQKVDMLQHEWWARIDTLLGVTHNKTFSREKIMSFVNSLELRGLEVRDSTRPVDCLFCDKRDECEDPKNKTAYLDLVKGIDDDLRRLVDYPDEAVRSHLREEGEMIKQMAAKHGLAPASFLMVVGRA
jgi:SAM-dependent methyltransferase